MHFGANWYSGMFTFWGFLLVVSVLGMILAALQRYWKHKERLAMIEKGLVPNDDGDGPYNRDDDE